MLRTFGGLFRSPLIQHKSRFHHIQTFLYPNLFSALTKAHSHRRFFIFLAAPVLHLLLPPSHLRSARSLGVGVSDSPSCQQPRALASNPHIGRRPCVHDSLSLPVDRQQRLALVAAPRVAGMQRETVAAASSRWSCGFGSAYAPNAVFLEPWSDPFSSPLILSSVVQTSSGGQNLFP